MALSTAVSFAQGMGPLALAPMIPQLIMAFDSEIGPVLQFTGVCILVLGFSNFIWYFHPLPRLIMPHRSDNAHQGPSPNFFRSTSSAARIHSYLPGQ